MNDSSTNELGLDELVEEFVQRWRGGERPSVEEYATRHPHWESDFREVLPALIMMEALKPQRGDTTGSTPRRPLDGSLPERLGDFRIVREIGRGGMGIVYEAEQEALGRRVAIKVLPRNLLADAKVRERFRREAQAAARLHHTNIVPVFGVGEQDGVCYYVMQMIDGRSLACVIHDQRAEQDGAAAGAEATFVAHKPARPARYAATFFRQAAQQGLQVAEALAYAHAQGIVHRDIKPSNLLLDERGTVWITDFGVAKLSADSNLTGHGELVGTLKYMPPERFDGKSDARGDIYSLGITLYEMLALRPAFPDMTPDNLLLRITRETPPRLRTLVPGVPRDLETILLKATAREPARRYATAGALAEDLRRFLDDQPIRARRTTALGHLWRWCRRNQTVAALSAAAAVLLVLITVVSVVGYTHTAAANAETTKALAAEKRQREQAETTSALALEAMNRIYERFAPSRLLVAPDVSADGAEEEQIEVPVRPVLSREATPLLQELLVFYERVAAQSGDYAKLRQQAAEANHRIGDVRQQLGQFEGAATAYERAIRLYSLLPEDPAGRAAQRLLLARSCNELGRVQRVLHQRDEERFAHSQALAALSELPELESQPAYRFELARTHYFLTRQALFAGGGEPPPVGKGPGPKGGGPKGPGPKGPPPPKNQGPKGPPSRGPGKPPHHHGDQPGKAPHHHGDQSFQTARLLLEGLVKEFPSVPDYRYLLACCYRDRPPERGPRGSELGKDSVGQAIELLSLLAEEFPDMPDYRYDLCETYAKVNVYRSLFPSEADLVLARLEQARTLAQHLVADYPGVAHYALSHAQIHHKLGILSRQRGRPEEAELLLREAMALQTAILKRFPETSLSSSLLAGIQISLGRLVSERRRWAEARPLLEEGVRRLEEAIQKLGRTGPGAASPSSGYRELATVLTNLGEKELAAEALRKADHCQTQSRPGSPPPGGPRLPPGGRK